MNLNTFAVNHADIITLSKNEQNPIPNRYLVTMDGVTFIYAVDVGKSVTIMSETFDNTTIRFEETGGEMTVEYALIAARHQVRVVYVGKTMHRIGIHINYPDGEYVTVVVNGETTLHQRDGKIFMEVGGVYLNVDKDIPSLKERYLKNGLGKIIPKDYLFRVMVDGNPTYHHVNNSYQTPGIAVMFETGTTPEFWEEHKHYLG